MATTYHVENIERITEQQIEEEVLNETESIRSDAINKIESIKDNAIASIDEQKNDAVSSLEDIKEKLKKIDSDTEDIYQNATTVIKNTENKIEDNIRVLIVENGCGLKYYNDGIGNVIVTIEEVE